MLTSCSEHSAEDRNEKVLQLELALVSAQSELQTDKALLAEAIRTGASPDQIAAIEKEVREDEIRLRTVALIVGGTGNPIPSQDYLSLIRYDYIRKIFY